MSLNQNAEGSPLENATDEAPIKADVRSDLHVAEAHNIIKNHVITAMGVSLIPFPVVDLVALTGIQIKMLHRLSKHYDVAFSENIVKKLIASLLGGLLPTSAAITIASMVKSVPGMGTTAGVISISLLGGAATYAVGSVFMQHFESGGTLLDFDPKKMRAYFNSKFQEGKQVAAKLKSQN